jgi:DNA-damage-inducible protein J
MMDLEVITMASINMSIRTDSELKAQAEAVLSQLGMNMNGTINMFLHQIVRDKAVPLSLSLSSEQAVYADLLAAQTERANGYEGRNARAVLAEMDEILAAAEDP